MDHYVMDVESVPNAFLVVFEHYKKPTVIVFTICSFRNDLVKLLNFLDHNRKHNEWHISFNGLSYDSQIIQYILVKRNHLLKMTGEEAAAAIYQVSQETIERSNNMEYPKYSPYQLFIHQLDVFKLNHWDNPAKSSSLKWIECSMDWPNIQESPIPFNKPISSIEELQLLSHYCRNDVAATKAIMQRNSKEIALRGTLTKDYGINLYSASEPRIAKELFLHFLSKKLKISKAVLRKKRTFRKSIKVGDILLPYLNFKVPAFQNVFEKFKKLEIDPLNLQGMFKFSVTYKGLITDFGLGGIHGAKKGVYTADEFMTIMTSDVVSYYPNLAIRNGWAPAHLPQKEFTEQYEWFFNERKLIPKKDPRNYVYKIILNATFGLSIDKNSFLYDPQFGMTITINGQLSLVMLYEMLIEQIPGAIPLMQNTDGIEIMIPRKYKDQYLAICKQWEGMTKLQLEHDEYQKIIIPDVNNYIAIFQYKELTKEDWLKEMHDSPENLYKRENGKFYAAKTKCKGRFEFKDMALHKNKSFSVIPRALFNYFVHGINVRDYIYSNKNIFDFCGQVHIKGNWQFKRFYSNTQFQRKFEQFSDKAKADWLSKNYWNKVNDELWVNTTDANHEAINVLTLEEAFQSYLQSQTYITEPLQKTIRYYISPKGDKIAKCHLTDGRMLQLEAGIWLQVLFNQYIEKPFEEYDIDYRYYISKAEKEIESLVPGTFSNQLEANLIF